MDWSGIDFKSIMQEQLVRSLDLEKYIFIMDKVHLVDVSRIDSEFQVKFNGFYGIRRNQDWRKSFYIYFQSIKNYSKSQLTFRNVLENVSEIEYSNNRFEPSFSSELYATLFPDEPIWDQYVLRNLGLLNAWNSNKTYDNAVTIYDQIRESYNSPQTRTIIEQWDSLFSNNERYQGISNTKKIDYILWSKR